LKHEKGGKKFQESLSIFISFQYNKKDRTAEIDKLERFSVFSRIS